MSKPATPDVRLFHASWRSIRTGAVIMLGVFIWRAVVTLGFGEGSPYLERNFPQASWPTASLAIQVARQVLLAPLLETSGMLILLVGLRWVLRLANKSEGFPATYILLCGLQSWLFHGANLLSVGQGVGFMVLALLALRLMREWPALTSFALVGLAHITWNALATAGYLATDALSKALIAAP